MTEALTFAVPKGRILDEALPLMGRAGLEPSPDFHDKGSRALQFGSNVPGLSIIRVRAFDAATFVAHGAADFGIVG
ncbi:MAG: ATP phosphoribosyltransferase, partial [Pacificimonas sp.]|nr:ATP phosphoribosyltransferase [Pacificimonas sp.]